MTAVYIEPIQVTPEIFWALIANVWNQAKDTDFKFDRRVPWDSGDMTPWKFSKTKRGQGHVTPKFWGLIANAIWLQIYMYIIIIIIIERFNVA